MSDERVSPEPARRRSGLGTQKPKYEAPAVVDLSNSARGTGNGCATGSTEDFDCMAGAIAEGECASGGYYL